MNITAEENVLADTYTHQLFDAISAVSGPNCDIHVMVDGTLTVLYVGDPQSLRELIDEFALEPLAEKLSGEHEGLHGFLRSCVGADEPTGFGFGVWIAALKDIGSSLSFDEGR